MSKPIKIKLFTDYICPWCYLGDAVVKNLSDQYDFEIEHIGFELHPDTAPEGNDILEQFPGSNEMFAGLRDRGKPYGLSFDQITILPNSQKALLVGEYAKEIGKGEEYILEMWKAYFGSNANIGEHQVIVDTAAKVGITETEVDAAIASEKYRSSLDRNTQECYRYGINSVPTFIIDEKYKVVGAQGEDVFRRVFDELQSVGDKRA